MYQTIPVPRIEGLNQNEDPTSLRPGELSVATNAYRRGELVGTRPGVVSLGASSDYEHAIDEANAIRGAHEYRRDFDEGRRLITVAAHAGSGNELFYQDGARLTTAGVSLTTSSDYIWAFANHRNTLYGTGGPPGKAQAVTEDIFTWDGNVANAAAVLALTDKGSGIRLRPKFIKSWRNYMLINGLQQAAPIATNNPTTTRFCDFGTDPTTDANWTDGNTLGYNANLVGIDGFGENFSTGFGTYQDNDGDWLVVLSNKQLASYQLDASGGNDFRYADSIDTGCVHQRAFVSLGLDAGDAVYVSEKGIHSLRQSQQFGGTDAKFLSWKIRPFFNSINRNRIHFTCGVYAARLGGILFAFSTGTETTHNALMWLDIKDPNSLTAESARWYGPWTLGGGIRVNHVAYLRDEAESYQLYIFTTAGRVLTFSESAFADLSSGYSTVLQTNHETYGDVSVEKRLGGTTATVATPIGGYSISHRAIFDFGRRRSSVLSVPLTSISGAVVGSAVVGTSTLVGSDFVVEARKLYTRGRGHTISHEFSHSGTNQPFYIARLDPAIAGAGEDAGATG